MSPLITDTKDFFYHWLEETLKSRKETLPPLMIKYLSNLLNSYILTENLFLEKEGKKEQPTLVFLLKEALEEENFNLKIKKYQQLGDTSLFMSGFFPGFFARKLVDIDYYISMGSGAYETLANSSKNKDFKNLYKGLSLEFSNVVDILGEMSSLSDETDTLRMYEVWQITKSSRLEKRLISLGINPTSFTKKQQ